MAAETTLDYFKKNCFDFSLIFYLDLNTLEWHQFEPKLGYKHWTFCSLVVACNCISKQKKIFIFHLTSIPFSLLLVFPSSLSLTHLALLSLSPVELFLPWFSAFPGLKNISNDI